MKTATSNDKELITHECLRHAIADTQETIRGYDNKALIVATLLTLSIGLTNYGLMSSLKGIPFAMLVISWIFSIVAIALLGMVLHPKVNNFKEINLGTYVPSGVYFIHNVTDSTSKSVNSLAEKALETNWVAELTYENMKVSYIRDMKHEWFVLALKSTGFTLAFVFLAIFLGVGRV